MKTILKALYMELRGVLFFGLHLVLHPFLIRAIRPDSWTRVLFFAQPGVGDAVYSLVAVNALKKTFPYLIVDVFSPHYCSGIFIMCPQVNHVITYGPGIGHQISCALELRKTGYDAVIDLNSDYTFLPVFLLFLSGARVRIGYNVARRGFLFHRSLKLPAEAVHTTNLFQYLMETIGVSCPLEFPLLVPGAEADTLAGQILASESEQVRVYIAIHPGGKYPTQRWGIDRFSECAERLCADKKIGIVIIGGSAEQKLMAGSALANNPHYRYCMNQSLSVTASILQRSSLLICNNSGPLHIAEALRTPTLSTMGPTIEHRWKPLGQGHVVLRRSELPCIGCNSGSCRIKTHDCMKKITVEDVMNSAMRQLTQQGKI